MGTITTEQIRDIYKVIDVLCDGDLASTEPTIKQIRSEVTLQDIIDLTKEVSNKL